MERKEINSLLEEMNLKIAQNKLTFRQEVSRLKLNIDREMPTPEPPITLQKLKTSRKNQSIPILPISHII